MDKILYDDEKYTIRELGNHYILIRKINSPFYDGKISEKNILGLVRLCKEAGLIWLK